MRSLVKFMRRSPRSCVTALFVGMALTILAASTLDAHDLFLKPFRYFVSPGSDARIRVLNGTFEKSENSVARNRIRDLTVVGPSGVAHPDTTAWSDAGDTSVFVFRAGQAGTYLVGASTLPRALRMEAKEFNEYLASDGVSDVLEARRRSNELNKPSHERYSKHVKTLLQVGDTRTPGFETVLGYPAELVPLDNPYLAKIGGTLRVRALVDGRPVANQLVIAGGRTPTGSRLGVKTLRSGSDGMALVPISSPGYWYVKFIHMVPVTGDSVNYESKWATLTFQIR
jgi:Domain of unknown function (DUF4198)